MKNWGVIVLRVKCPNLVPSSMVSQKPGERIGRGKYRIPVEGINFTSFDEE